jgi:hypothetical protein
MFHFVEREERLRPGGSSHNAALPLGGMADAHLVVDIAVGNGDVGQDEVRDRETFDHFVNDEVAYILVCPDGLVAGFVDSRTESGFPEPVEVYFIGGSGTGWGAGRLGTVRHDHKAERAWHGESQHQILQNRKRYGKPPELDRAFAGGIMYQRCRHREGLISRDPTTVTGNVRCFPLLHWLSDRP